MSNKSPVFYYRATSVRVPKNVAHVRVEDSVHEIPEGSFLSCKQLTDLELPDGLQVIGIGAFATCCAIEFIAFPSTVKEIRHRAMANCRRLTGIELPEELQWLGKEAFRFCNSLRNVAIPPLITEIQQQTFYGCRSLRSVTLPEGLTVIGDSAFACCFSLSRVAIPSTVHEIGNRAFSYCRRLKTIRVPSGVTVIQNSTFESCSALISVELPEHFQVLGNATFMRCATLRNICISPPGPVGTSAFAGCENLIQKSDNNDMSLVAELKTRFDVIDVFNTHKVCYYHAHYSTEEALEDVRLAVETYGDNAICIGDRFGMTPLHILALSTEPKVVLFQALLENSGRPTISNGFLGKHGIGILVLPE